MKKLWDSFMGTLRNMGKGKGGGKPIKPAPVVTGYFNGKVNTDVIELDATTKAAVAAATTVTGKLQAVQAALAHPVTVRVFSGATEVGTGTLNSPGFNLSGDFLTPTSFQSFSVSQSGTPSPSTWTLRFESGSRWMRGTFGLANSGANFTWSLSTWAAGQVGMIGTVSITAAGANVQPQWAQNTPATIDWLSAGQSYNFAQHASDPNGDPLTFSLSPLGDGYTLTSAGVLTIGTVSKSVTITASDGVLSTPHVCGVTVQVSTDFWPAQNVSAFESSFGMLPVIPNVPIYGANQYGGSGRHPTGTYRVGTHAVANRTFVLFVDRLSTASVGGSEAGSTNRAFNTTDRIAFGSLAWCLTVALPSGYNSRVVIPLVSGLIDYAWTGARTDGGPIGTDLSVYSQFVTYAGQTAPANGLYVADKQIYSGPINLGVHDDHHLFWHLPMLESSRNTTSYFTNGQHSRHNITASRVLIANGLSAWGQDECWALSVDASNPSHNVGFWQCLNMEPIGNFWGSGGNINTGHGIFSQIGTYGIANVAISRTVHAYCSQRQPLASIGGSFLNVNNLILGPDEWTQANYQANSSGRINHESNVSAYVTPTRAGLKRPIDWWDANAGQIHVGTNETTGNKNRQLFPPWAETSQGTSANHQTSRISSAWPAGFVEKSIGTAGTSTADALEMAGNILDSAGAYPNARLATIQRVIDYGKNLLAQNGQGYGGWWTETNTALLTRVASVYPSSVPAETIANPFSSQSVWGNRAVPAVVGGDRDVPYTSGAFLDGTSKVGYTRLEEFLYEVHLLRSPS